MGEQRDGTNVAFLFKGGNDTKVIAPKETKVEETTTEETTTPEESFRLSPEKFSSMEIELIETLIKENSVPFDSELEKYWSKSWIGNVNVTNELERLHNLYLRSQRKNLKKEQQQLLYEINNLRTRLNLSDPLGYDDVDVTTISDELGLTLYDAFDKGIITEEERKNLAKFVQGKPIPKKLETNNELNNIEDIIVGLKDKYADKTVEGLRSWEQSPEESFRLTPQQEEFFKDSKVRDENGELLKVYHGTSSEDFEVFDPIAEEGDKVLGDGTYFSRFPQQANNYTKYDYFKDGNKQYKEGNPRVVPAYLNLKNPFIIEGYNILENQKPTEPTTEMKNRFREEQIKYSGGVQGFNNQLPKNEEGYWYNNWYYLPPDVQTKILMDFGFDGVTDGGVYVAFNPEQIKSQFNVEPTSDPRMSYRLTPEQQKVLDDDSDVVKKISNTDIIIDEDSPVFADNKEIAKFLMDKTNKAQKEGNINLKLKNPKDGYTSKQEDIIAEIISREAVNEILSNPNDNAGAWYSEKMENAIKLIGDLNPEILTDIDSRTTFTIALAITSNGTNPNSNLKYALEVYDEFKKTGKFPENFNKAGAVSESMSKAFERYNGLVNIYGQKKTNEFLNTLYTVKELNDLGFKIVGENVDQKVPGSIIFGPKIGGAFYPNLQGDYSFVTFDRWYMRTMGRITGELVKDAKFENQYNRFRKAMMLSPSQLNKLNVNLDLFKTDNDYVLSVAYDIVRDYAKGGFKKKTKINMSANNLIKQYGLVDRPKGGGQRKSFRSIMEKATQKTNNKLLTLKENITTLYPADIQAIIWFPEKRLYSKLRKTKSILKETSYEDEAKAILKDRGYDDKRITTILSTNKDFDTKGGAFAIQKSQEEKAPLGRVKLEKTFRITSKPSLHLDPPTVLQNIATTLQDQMLRLKVVQEKVGDIPEDQDAYMQSELFIGKATEKIDNFRTEVLEPLVKELTDAGLTLDDLGDYLYAKHSGERNKLILERDPEKENGSGMSQKDADVILNKFKDTNIDQFADKVYDILNQRLDMLYDNGMITKEDYDYFKGDKLFTNYVPLKGLPGDNTNPQIGKGFSILGKDIKKARGRGSRANNPFIQSIMDFEETIIRTEKNKVTEAFYNLVLANPSDIWSAKGVKHIPRFDKNGELQYLDPIDLKQNEIEVKIKGKRKIITINDPALLRSMQTLGAGKSISWLNTFNTYFRNINTIFNPEFIITNFTRDLQTGLFNLSADHKSLSKQVLKNIVKAQLGIRNNIKGKDSEWARLYQEYKDNGGKVGWFDQMTLEDKTKNLESLLKKYKSKSMIGNSLRVVQKAVMDWNEMVEMGVRLSTYKVLIDNGVSPKKSAQYSKNQTVNFNKKGEAGAVLKSLYFIMGAYLLKITTQK